ncbi:MAG: chemotaxis-specific protein-glutamate methyltransferase CheB [Deltaproteobacteria bacterium]|nr:chemotaxis-specific protein-glutamate methyltransferase CheB [Deltaproteobacteria bacterium]
MTTGHFQDGFETDGSQPIRVLIVDDTAFSRRTIKGILDLQPNIQVIGSAVDGQEALMLVERLEPDVITLDLEMPKLSGFAFLRILMRRNPKPVVVVSSYSGRNDVLRALELGALDFVAKPSHLATPELEKIGPTLTNKVIEASQARLDNYLKDAKPEDVTGFHSIPAILVKNDDLSRDQPGKGKNTQVSTGGDSRNRSETRSGNRVPPQEASQLTEHGAVRFFDKFMGRNVDPNTTRPVRFADLKGIVVIAASTGGPRALRHVLKAGLPLDWAVAIVQHMPAGFTKDFAKRLARKLQLDVIEAEQGMVLVPGRILIAPGGSNMLINRRKDGLPVVSIAPPGDQNRYVPSADVLFETSASVFGSKTIAVILTGMGNDGVAGAEAVKNARGTVVAEDESTAVVFGMPGKAFEAGVVDHLAPLDRISPTIKALASTIDDS